MPPAQAASQEVELQDFEDVTLLAAPAEPIAGHSSSGWRDRLSAWLPRWGGGNHSTAGFARLSVNEQDGDFAEKPGHYNPEEQAGWWSSLFFSYVNSLIKLGFSKTLEPEDMWDTNTNDEAGAVSDKFQETLANTADPLTAPQGVVWRAMWRQHGRMFIWSGVIKLVHDIVMFLGPFVLEKLLKHLERGGDAWMGFLLCIAMGCSNTLETLTVNQYFYMLYRISLHLKISLIDMLYRKSLRITSATKGAMGVGAIVNLQSNDASKLWQLVQYLHIIWSGPFQILVVMGLLMRIIHVLPAVAGLSVTIALTPATILVGKRLRKVRQDLIKCTDARVKMVTEVITGIKAIKLYAWEEPYMDRVNELRQAELRMIRKAAFYGIFNTFMFGGGPILVSLASFSTYTLLGYSLTAGVAFPALALFNLLRFPVMMFPNQIMNLIAGKVALNRIQKYMQEEELQQQVPQPAAQQGTPAVLVQNGTFAWEAGGAPLLQHVNFEVTSGQLLIVVGEVGAGKSSLLSALLGEMFNEGGVVRVAGNIGYTSQDPWIQNATLKDNILMGRPYNAERYQRVINACAMTQDLAMLPAGDQSEIGEKGINLSGGQRHRVALARACYADADVYLLDDPLSAVDAHVGRHLFEACLCGLLREKTRILVTHQLHYLHAADLVAVVKKGQITDLGSYEDLVARGVDFQQFQLREESESASEGESESEAISVIEELSEEGATDAETADLLSERRRSHDEASSSSPTEAGSGSPTHRNGSNDSDKENQAARDQFLDGNGHMSMPDGNDAKGLLLNPLKERSSSLRHGSGELRRSSDRHKGKSRRTSISSPKGSKTTSRSASGTAKAGSMKRPSAGQLVKAEERAVGRVDRGMYRAYLAAWGPAYIIPGAMVSIAVLERTLQVLQNWWLSVWSNATLAAETQHTTIHTGHYLAIYFSFGLVSLGLQVNRSLMLVFGAYNASKRLHTNLLAKVMRLPMSFFDSQPTGRLLNRFTRDTEAVDVQVAQSVQSFLNCSVSVLGALVVVTAVTPGIAVAIAILGAVYYRVQVYYIATSRELKRLDSLALSPIYGNFNETLQGLLTVRAFRAQTQFGNRNRNMLNASNRVWWPIQLVNRWLSVRLEMLGIGIVFGAALFVAVLMPRNAGLAGLALTSALNLTGLMNWMVRQATELEVNMNAVERVIEYTKLTPEKPAIVAGHRPPQGWPLQGVISTQNLVVKYRPDLDPVLKGISFTTRPSEKIGVVGRTGCGKSTLMMSLYRIVEPCGGTITVDSVDVTQIGLTDLRSRLALVPQDPVIFSGSVRANLDPFDVAGGDVYIWEALKQAGMAETIQEMGGLDANISEGGGNLSVGQRQLLCMARALLRRTKVLVLDEATSNVDNATDNLIQSTIRTAFKDCTVLTIAHRLHTIIDSDRIMVLDAGQLMEFDSPDNLLKNPNSLFSKLVAETTKGSTGVVQRTSSVAPLIEGVAEIRSTP